ncbi:hypothetical protein EDC01DRAFT_678728 [Geopyxis carbonaria]|nr:hypothetical protein EDC01DRAFT_678728 [Geopyxis carbonaria]
MSATVTTTATTNHSRTAAVLTRAFAHDPVHTYIRCAVPSSTPAASFVTSLPHYNTIEACNFAAVAVWSLTGTLQLAPETDDATRAYEAAFEPVRKRWLAGKAYILLQWLARDPGREEKGVVRALLERIPGDAKPVWIEANTARARDIYLHLGWKVCQEVVLFEGLCRADGKPDVGGSGVTTWAMIKE